MSEMWIRDERRIKKVPKLLGRVFLVPLFYAAGICSELQRMLYIVLKGMLMVIAI